MEMEYVIGIGGGVFLFALSVGYLMSDFSAASLEGSTARYFRELAGFTSLGGGGALIKSLSAKADLPSLTFASLYLLGYVLGFVINWSQTRANYLHISGKDKAD